MTKKQCSKMVNNSKYEVEPHLCANPAKVERDGKWYCRIHDPEYIKYKAANQKATRDREFNLSMAQGEAWNQCLTINPDNPRAVADAIGDMYKALNELVNALGNPMEVPPFELVEKASNALNKAGGKE